MNVTDSEVQLCGEVRVQLFRLSEAAPADGGSPEDHVAYWHQHVTQAPWYDPEKEMVVVLCLNMKLKVTAFALVSIGCLTETILHPRECFRPAVAAAAWGVVVMHNHPSGDPTPSKPDVAVTARLAASGEVLSIRLIDSVIVGNSGRFTSMYAIALASGQSLRTLDYQRSIDTYERLEREEARRRQKRRKRQKRQTVTP